MKLDGKVALITGGSRGIGKGIVERFLEEGADVAFTYVSSPEKANALAQELAAKSGRKVLAIQSDAGNFDQAQKAVDEVVAAWGKLDVLVNNAGITKDRMFLKMSREDWDAVIETNLNSMFNVTKQVVADMVEKGWGRIINISSVNGEKGQAGVQVFPYVPQAVEHGHLAVLHGDLVFLETRLGIRLRVVTETAHLDGRAGHGCSTSPRLRDAVPEATASSKVILPEGSCMLVTTGFSRRSDGSPSRFEMTAFTHQRSLSV